MMPMTRKRGKRREYVEKRRVYKRAVGKAKRKLVESKRNELEKYDEESQEMVEHGIAGYDRW